MEVVTPSVYVRSLFFTYENTYQMNCFTASRDKNITYTYQYAFLDVSSDRKLYPSGLIHWSLRDTLHDR